MIGIAYTTFLRPDLMRQTLLSIIKNWHPLFEIFIGYQMDDPKIKPEIINIQNHSMLSRDFMTHKIKRHHLTFFPFDAGVSIVRNKLIQDMSDVGIKYCIVTADSIEFTHDTILRLWDAMAFMEAHKEAAILGFDLKDRVAWEWNMELRNQRFVLSRTPDVAVDEASGLRIKPCDICRQFFLARVDAILKVKWDEAFKTGEHEDFFWRFKAAGYKVYWTPDISGQYIHSRPPEYERYRNRQYDVFMKMLFNKYNLTNWVEYVR